MKYRNNFEISSSEETVEGKLNAWMMRGAFYDVDKAKLELKHNVELKLQEIIDKQELPAIVKKMAEINPDVFGRYDIILRTRSAIQAFPQILKILQEGFFPVIVEGMLKATLNEVITLNAENRWKFEKKFSRLHDDKELRKEIWGITDHISLFVALSILSDIIAGINIDNPTDEEVEKSVCADTARRFRNN